MLWTFVSRNIVSLLLLLKTLLHTSFKGHGTICTLIILSSCSAIYVKHCMVFIVTVISQWYLVRVNVVSCLAVDQGTNFPSWLLYIGQQLIKAQSSIVAVVCRLAVDLGYSFPSWLLDVGQQLIKGPISHHACCMSASSLSWIHFPSW